MLVLFKPSPQSILKAFMASRIHKAKPVENTESKQFFFEDSVDAESLDYDSVYSQYKERFGGLDFLEDEKLWEILEDEIFWASRYNSLDRFQLVFTVLGQIEKGGTKPYLAQQSSEAKEMKDRLKSLTPEQVAAWVRARRAEQTNAGHLQPVTRTASSRKLGPPR